MGSTLGVLPMGEGKPGSLQQLSSPVGGSRGSAAAVGGPGPVALAEANHKKKKIIKISYQRICNFLPESECQCPEQPSSLACAIPVLSVLTQTSLSALGPSLFSPPAPWDLLLSPPALSEFHLFSSSPIRYTCNKAATKL